MTDAGSHADFSEGPPEKHVQASTGRQPAAVRAAPGPTSGMTASCAPGPALADVSRGHAAAAK